MSNSRILPIKAARVIVTCPGRNFVTLKIETADGSYRPRGCHLEWPRARGGELSRRSRHPYADRARRAPDRGHLAVPVSRRLLAARSGHHERHCGSRYGALGPESQSGRAAALPAAGRRLPHRRAGVRPCQRPDGRGDHRRGAALSRPRLHGHPPAVRVCPGSPRPMACRATRCSTSRPTARCRPRIVWSTPKYLASVPALFAAARAALGWDVDLLHDTHHRLTPIEAARLGKDLEPYRLFWLEDTVAADNQESFRLIRQHTTTPLGGG